MVLSGALFRALRTLHTGCDHPRHGRASGAPSVQAAFTACQLRSSVPPGVTSQSLGPEHCVKGKRLL